MNRKTREYRWLVPAINRPSRCADLLVAIAGVGAFMVAHHRAWTFRSIPGSGLAIA